MLLSPSMVYLDWVVLLLWSIGGQQDCVPGNRDKLMACPVSDPQSLFEFLSGRVDTRKGS